MLETQKLNLTVRPSLKVLDIKSINKLRKYFNKLISEARHLKSVEALLDDEDINKTKEISKDAARTE